MVQVLQPQRQKQPSFLQSVMGGLAEGVPGAIQQYQQGKEKNQQKEAVRQLMGEGFENLPPEYQKMAYEYALKGNFENQKRAAELRGNQAQIRDIEKRRDLPEGSLDAYINDPKAAEQITRPAKEPKKTQSSQPIDPEQLKIIHDIRSQPGFSDLDELGQYQALTGAGVSKENAEAESKLRGQQLTRQQQNVQAAYKAQENFINETTSSYKGFETEMKPRLLQMQSIPDEDIIGPTASVFLDELGIPLGVLEDPSSELYNKLSQDLLKGLPETYGSRILKVEVDNFLKTIPTLMNSPDGRRMIASNMLKLGEMKEVYYNEMRRQQKDFRDSGKPLPADFQQEVFDQVKPQIDRINNEFVKLAQIKSVPKGEAPYFGNDGQVYFVPQTQDWLEWASENGMKKIW